jgi:hypothetical protein
LLIIVGAGGIIVKHVVHDNGTTGLQALRYNDIESANVFLAMLLL